MSKFFSIRFFVAAAVFSALFATFLAVNARAQSTNSNQNAQEQEKARANNNNQNQQTARSAATADARALRRLAREVRGELASLPYYDVFDYLEFEVRPDNSVILRGQTIRPTLKRDAQNLVEDIEGVTRVDNQIEVLPLSPNDDQIRLAVYRELFNQNSPLFRYSLGAVPPIRIIVNRGRLTLKGVVASEADRNLAYIRARTVPGIFEVINELQIERRETAR